METLQSRSELKQLLETFARDVFDQVMNPLLKDGHAWKVGDLSSGVWVVLKDEGSKTTSDTAKALVHLLELLEHRLFSVAPPSSQAAFTFSKVFVPHLLPDVLKYLKGSLPNRLGKPIASSTTPILASISQLAKEVYDALLECNYLQDGLRDEGEELLDWSRHVHRHYMKSLGTQLRKRARDLLLREAGGGWQAVTVEFEVEVEMPTAVKEHVQQRSEAGEVESILASKEANDENGDEEAWSTWDDEGAQAAPSIGIERTSSLSGKSRQKKSALGGRRVVKPADELGSGPLPEEENGDDVSWGFDDDMTTTLASGSGAGPNQAQYNALMESLDQEEDVDEDAWGLSEEEKVERAAKRASMRGDMAAAFQAYQANQEKQQPGGLQQIPDAGDDEEEEDDAWGLSAQEKEAVHQKRQSVRMEKPSAAQQHYEAPKSHVVNDDEEDDDAWGLSAQEKEAINKKRQSIFLENTTVPVPTDPSSIQIANEEESEDQEDAWGLSVQEKENLARKRQSVLLEEDVAPEPSISQSDVAEENEEDAWGLSDQEKEALAVKSQSAVLEEHPPLLDSINHASQELTSPIQEVASSLQDQEQASVEDSPVSAQLEEGSGLLVEKVDNTPRQDALGEEEDAWGLSDQEKESLPENRHRTTSEEPIYKELGPAILQGDTANLTSRRHEMEEEKKMETSEEKRESAPLDDSLPSTSAVEESDLLANVNQHGLSVPKEEDAWNLDEQKVPDKAVTQDAGDVRDQDPWDSNFSEEGSVSKDRDHHNSSSDKNTTRHLSPKTSTTSSSFTRTSRTLDMEEGDSNRGTRDSDEPASDCVSSQHLQETESLRDDEQDEIEDAWDVRDETLSGSEGAATGGEKSSGSGEKLSDTTTEPWEEVQAAPSNVQPPHPPPPSTGISEWAWNEEEASGTKSSVPQVTTAAAAAAVGVGLATASLASANRAQSPIGRTVSPRGGSTASPQLRQATLRSASSAARKGSQSRKSPSRPKEKCIISQRSVSLVELIKEVLGDVEAVLEEGEGESLDTGYLVVAVNDIMDMHRALLPVGHADTLANVPSLAMQFANDCSYIGKELREMQKRWSIIKSRMGGNEGRGGNMVDFNVQAQLTMALGKRSFDGQLLLQHKMLMDCLIDAEGFTSTYEEARFQACQRSIKQIEFVLKQLQSAWKPVLTKSSYLGAMGKLVDGVLRRVLMDVEAVEDISEVESVKLASLIKSLGDLEHIFRDETRQPEEVSFAGQFYYVIGL